MRRLGSLIWRWWEDPWRRPVFLATATWLYVLWSIVPVLIAIQFSFNSGRSRSAWQGFSFRWWWGDETRSLLHDDSLRQAMTNSLVLAVLTMLIATPLGVAPGARSGPVARARCPRVATCSCSCRSRPPRS